MKKTGLFPRPVLASQAPPAPAKPAPPPLPALLRDPKYGSAEEIMALPPAKLAVLLDDAAATEYAKAKACMRLAVVGVKEAVPALSRLLADARLSHYARYALEPMEDPAAGEALIAALPRLQGMLLVGAIHSLAVRRERRAIDALAALRNSDEPPVAQAAEEALAKIRPAL